ALMPIALFESELEMPFPHHPRRPRRFHRRRDKGRLRISITEWLQHFMPMQQIEVDFRQPDFSVEVQAWSEPFVRQLPAHGIQKLLAEFRQIFFVQTHPCRHFVPAKFFQRSAGFAEGPHDRTTLDTASASFSSAALVKSDNNRR